MRAMILAAGLGTRLRPLTDQIPKPLVLVSGKPMIEYPLAELERFGITEVLINIHYLPQRMVSFINEWNQQKRSPRLFIQDETKMILNSGGGVKKAAAWLFQHSSTALIYNSDVIASPALEEFHRMHQELVKNQGTLLTLGVMENDLAGLKYNGVKVQENQVVGFEKNNIHTPDLFHFPGFYFLESNAFTYLTPGAPEDFSILDCLWKPLIQAKKMSAWIYNGKYFDLGTKEDLLEAERKLSLASG